jgi:hypothetical protein
MVLWHGAQAPPGVQDFLLQPEGVLQLVVLSAHFRNCSSKGGRRLLLRAPVSTVTVGEAQHHEPTSQFTEEAQLCFRPFSPTGFGPKASTQMS